MRCVLPQPAGAMTIPRLACARSCASWLAISPSHQLPDHVGCRRPGQRGGCPTHDATELLTQSHILEPALATVRFPVLGCPANRASHEGFGHAALNPCG